MRRYVIERTVGNYDREKLQVCIVYPSTINRKQIAAEHKPFSYTEHLMTFDKKAKKWRMMNNDE